METDKGISDTHEMVGGGPIKDSKRENVVFSFIKNNHGNHDNNDKTSLLIGEAKMFEAYGGNFPSEQQANTTPKNIKLKGVTFYKREKKDKYTVETDTNIKNITVMEDSMIRQMYNSIANIGKRNNNTDAEKTSKPKKTAKDINAKREEKLEKVAYLVINDTEGKHVYCAVIPYKGNDDNEFNIKGNVITNTKKYNGIILPGGDDKNISGLSEEMLKRINDIANDIPNKPVKT